jgi:DNA-directed RNA polymerase subunit K/omega
MPIQIDKILSFEGNKYEKTCAMIKYARHLAQKNEENLEIPINRYTKEKITVSAINDILTGKVTYHLEAMPEEK